MEGERMTAEETIKKLGGIPSILMQCHVSFERINEYCGALNEAIVALKIRTPKKPVNHDQDGNRCACDRCPTCFEPVWDKYCGFCGQAIDFEGVE